MRFIYHGHVLRSFSLLVIMLAGAACTQSQPTAVSQSPSPSASVASVASVAPVASVAAIVDAGPRVDTMSFEDLAAEFRRLRAVHGHMSGGDEWIDDVDSSGGRKLQVMNELQKRITPGMPLPELEKLLGMPDATERQNGADEVIYEWRGRHDYLFFRIENDQVQSSKWWYAGE